MAAILDFQNGDYFFSLKSGNISASNHTRHMSLVVFQQLIMQKAAEELKKQQEREMEEKRKAIEERVPKLEIDGLDKRKSKLIQVSLVLGPIYKISYDLS